jgi:hypothetical protein
MSNNARDRSLPRPDRPPRRRRRVVQAAKSPDDVVVVSALRTPITRAKRGGLNHTPADDLLATLLKARPHMYTGPHTTASAW